VRSNIRINPYLIAAIIVIAGFAGVLAICSAEESQTEKPNENSKCYVCHLDMKTEELTTDHLDMDVTCDECHGPSTEHMHDEMLMTEPDLKFGRSEVEKMCSNPTCHKPGDGREVYGRQDHARTAGPLILIRSARTVTAPTISANRSKQSPTTSSLNGSQPSTAKTCRAGRLRTGATGRFNPVESLEPQARTTKAARSGPKRYTRTTCWR